MSAPAFTIVIPLEGAPRIYCDAEHEGDYQRLSEWVESNPDLVDLLDHALGVRELWRERRAA